MMIYLYRGGELVETVDIGDVDRVVIVNGTSAVCDWNKFASKGKRPPKSVSDIVVKAADGEWHFDNETNAIRRAQKLYNGGDDSVKVMVQDKVIWPNF